MAGAASRLLGSWGESRAADYLKSKGYTITARNYSTRFGEIDIIAENKFCVAFVEVKLRRSRRFMEAKENVDPLKQQRIVVTAGQWLCQNETGKQPRFDVIEVYAPDGIGTQHPEIIHTENAFHGE